MSDDVIRTAQATVRVNRWTHKHSQRGEQNVSFTTSTKCCIWGSKVSMMSLQRRVCMNTLCVCKTRGKVIIRADMKRGGTLTDLMSDNTQAGWRGRRQADGNDHK